LIGLRPQAFLVIYAPVWVDEFAPPGLCTLWMSLMQGGVAIGIMVGYAIGGLILNLTKPTPEMGHFKMRMLVMIPMMLQVCGGRSLLLR
jgi:hypothetical protein